MALYRNSFSDGGQIYIKNSVKCGLFIFAANNILHAYLVSRDLDDIDLFPGAMAERPVSGGLVGPTFACILAQQFSNLKKGSTVLYFWVEKYYLLFEMAQEI
jgi:hypothetical protein